MGPFICSYVPMNNDSVQKGFAEVARLLIAAGADVNARLKNGWSPLYVAVTRNAAEIAAILLEAGAARTEGMKTAGLRYTFQQGMEAKRLPSCLSLRARM